MYFDGLQWLKKKDALPSILVYYYLRFFRLPNLRDAKQLVCFFDFDQIQDIPVSSLLPEVVVKDCVW